MGKEYFTGVEFPELEPAPEPEELPKDDPATKVEWDTILTELRRMIAAVESGDSNIVKHAIDVSKAPINKVLKNLADKPTTDHMVAFLKVAQQDINLRFRRECVLLFKQNEKLKKLIEEKNIE